MSLEPMSDAADQPPQDALERIGGALIESALALPRVVQATVEQLVSAWEAVQAIPQIRDSLAAIETDTRTMTDEVTSMRAGVNRLEGGMNDLGGSVGTLGGRIEEVGNVLRPLRRLGGRLRGPVPNGVTPEVEDAVAEAATEPPAES